MTTHEIRAALHKGLRETRPHLHLDFDTDGAGRVCCCTIGAIAYGAGIRPGCVDFDFLCGEVGFRLTEGIISKIAAANCSSRLAGVRVLARWLRERERRGE